MIKYTADSDLIEILCNNGFIETTSLRDGAKGKREFKLKKTSPKFIYFDYINIRLYDGMYQDENITLSSDEVKAMIFYFVCNREDYKAIRSDGNFKFAEIFSQIDAARERLKLKQEFPAMRMPEARVRRALSVYDSIIVP